MPCVSLPGAEPLPHLRGRDIEVEPVPVGPGRLLLLDQLAAANAVARRLRGGRAAGARAGRAAAAKGLLKRTIR